MESSQAQTNGSLQEKLSGQTWQKRVLLVIAPSENDEHLQKQRDLLHTQQNGLQDRDMEIIYLPLNTITEKDKAFLSQNFNVKESQSYSILIGKDGTEKLRSQTPIPTDKLFDTIDAMPMRKGEMKNK